jgi:hypothetical protein
MRWYEPVASGARLWGARYTKVARFVRRVRRRVRKKVWTEKTRPVIVSCALAVVMGYLIVRL